MATLQTNHGPGARTDAGNHILDAADSIGAARTKPIAERLASFKKAHAAYVAADQIVKATDKAVREQQIEIAEADVVQDDRVDALATAAVGEGMPRLAPFKPFGFGSPGSIKRMGNVAEARAVLALATAVQQREPALPKSRKAAKALAAAGNAVLAAAAPLDGLEAKRKTAMSKRSALELIWEKAFAAVKHAARAAEADGVATGLYAALFASAPARPKASKRAAAAKKAKAAAAKEGAPAPAQPPV